MKPNEKLVVYTNNGTYIASHDDNKFMMIRLRELLRHLEGVNILDIKRMYEDDEFIVLQEKIYVKSEWTFKIGDKMKKPMYVIRIVDSDLYYDGSNRQYEDIQYENFSELCNAYSFNEESAEDWIINGHFALSDDLEIVKYGEIND